MDFYFIDYQIEIKNLNLLVVMQTEVVNRTAEIKYRESIALYSDSTLSIKHICEQTGVGFAAFCSYLSKHHRELILKRHNLTEYSHVQLRGSKGQTTAAHYKYKDAIAACDSTEYIEYNISQIARIFGLDCTALANQLRRHYPEIVPRREQTRQRMGIAGNLQYGVRKWTQEGYAEAVAMLQSTELTIDAVADACQVSASGFREHVLAYHPEITAMREQKRTEAIGCKVRGERSGNWTLHEPDTETIARYEQAIALYRDTAHSVESIVRQVGVSLGGFRYYLRTWHPELMVQRRGFDQGVELEQTKRYKKTTAEKYAEAIEQLRCTDQPTTKVAARFGLNPDIFRMYVKEHFPELTAARGMIRTSNGKIVKSSSAEKYAEALHVFQTTTEPLKSIASRMGLTYNSLGGYIRRSCPEAIGRHRSLVALERKNENIKKRKL